ncbi:putative response regulator and transcription factor RR-A-type family [Helianthus debilis subsp. tardiflorus]
MEVRLMVKGCLEKEELRINEDVSGSDRAESVKQQLQHEGAVIQWDRFLPLRSLKVLLVEDDDSTRHVVRALLRNCSYEVTAVANGLEAWKVLTDLNKQIDLVLTEVVMPHLSGIGLLSKIMNLVPRKNTPVIMMSSDDSMGIVFNCLSKGAVDFLVKPIRKNELKNLWQHVWRKCHSSSGSESESGVGAHKPTKARSIEISDDDSDEDDDRSMDLIAKDGSDDGSGTQSSWPKRVVEVETTKYQNPPDSTCAQVVHARPDKTSTREHAGEDDKLDAIVMGKDLEIGAPRKLERSIESNLKETSEPRTKPTNNVMIGKSNASPNSKYSLALDLSLKGQLDVEDTNVSIHKRNVLKQSDLSAFSRYNNTTTNNALDGVPNPPDGDKTARFQVHHDAHKIQQQQQEMANQDDGSSRNVVSNGSTAPAETNYGSASGSNSKSNGENRNSGEKGDSYAAVIEGGDNGLAVKGKFGNISGSGGDQDRLAQREAALSKFRQKRKNRCFEKKVRYQSRKKLAEQRPRVRGQFVRQGGKDADS